MIGDPPDLALSRKLMESRWWELQDGLERETGLAPRQRGWVLLAVAAAAGFGLAWSRGS